MTDLNTMTKAAINALLVTPLNPERPEPERKGHGAADALPHKAGGGGPMAGQPNRQPENEHA